MNKSQTLALAGFILLGALVVWQYRRISEMEDGNAATGGGGTLHSAAGRLRNFRRSQRA